MWGRRRRDEDRALAVRELDQLSSMIGNLVSLRDGSLPITAHPTVYGLRSLIADTVSMLPMVSLRGTERLEPQPSILRRPDPAEPRRATLEKIVNSLTRTGNAFLYVYDYDRDGFPLAVRVINPARVTAVLDPDATRVAQWQINGQPVPANRIKHIPLMLDPGPLGTSPLVACRDAFATLTMLWGFASSYWEDGGVPPYAIKHPRRLTAEQADEFATQWLEARRRRRPALLSDGLALETYPSPSASDALLLDGLNYFDAAIARAFLCPPSIVNVLSQSSLTYATTTDELRRWLALSLSPSYLARIEAAFSDFTPRGQVAVFDTSNLLRTDYSARVATGTAAVGAGLITVDEWRAQEGLPALPTGIPVSISPTVEGI
jgi:HK97 family phage portal protein